MSASVFELCSLYGKDLKSGRTEWINAVEFVAGSYYILLALLGFRNIYVIFFQQKKFSSIIFPLMYLFAQLACIL